MLMLDNFSKLQARQNPSIERGVFSQMLWTGFAVKNFRPPRLVSPLRFVYTPQHRLVPAMPPTIVGTLDETLHDIGCARWRSDRTNNYMNSISAKDRQIIDQGSRHKEATGCFTGWSWQFSSSRHSGSQHWFQRGPDGC